MQLSAKLTNSSQHNAEPNVSYELKCLEVKHVLWIFVELYLYIVRAPISPGHVCRTQNHPRHPPWPSTDSRHRWLLLNCLNLLVSQTFTPHIYSTWPNTRLHDTVKLSGTDKGINFEAWLLMLAAESITAFVHFGNINRGVVSSTCQVKM